MLVIRVALILLLSAVAKSADVATKNDFERLMEERDIDFSVINTLGKDACLQNKAACLQWVRQQHKMLQDQIGRVHMDRLGQPRSKVPDSFLYEEELLLEDGADSPYP